MGSPYMGSPYMGSPYMDSTFNGSTYYYRAYSCFTCHRTSYLSCAVSTASSAVL